jgi:organic radical activating enzyme
MGCGALKSYGRCATATINEIFFSVQGEGKFTGTPMQFIRFYGCNLDCSWCDQPAALTTHPQSSRFYEMDNESIAELITRHPLDVPVCFTGGEPFMQAQHMWQITLLVREQDREKTSYGERNGFKKRLLTAETNGTQFYEEFEKDFYLSMSPKFDDTAGALLNLAEETVSRPLEAHGELQVRKWIDTAIPMHLKFVVTSDRQFEGILEWVQRVVPDPRRRSTIPLYFQPEWFNGKPEFKKIIQKWVECERWRSILDMGFADVRFLTQMHKNFGVR